MNYSLLEADRGTYRKILGLAAAVTIVIMLVSIHARKPNQLEASCRQPIVLHLAAPKEAQSVAVAGLN
jgi:hypothetical protein